MRERSLIRVLTLSLLITLCIAVVAILFELFRSMSLSLTSGIGIGVGGFSEKFIALIVIGSPVVFALAYFFLRPRKVPPRTSRKLN
jgi:hypothetical protein